MSYDLQETIAASATPCRGAARSIVRLSGPGVVDCLAPCFAADEPVEWAALATPTRLAGVIRAAGDAESPPLVVHGHLYLWPGSRSYTRQPSAEFHMPGSPPLATAVLEEVCRRGARPARPGEFTLRGFLAGRLDLAQAEAVLGVVDARTQDDLNSALEQLAGGLSRPLTNLRERLIAMLAELEAELDFADERLEFIGRDELRSKIADGVQIVALALAQLESRGHSAVLPRIVLVGPPNVGKSSLFNALCQRFGDGPGVRSLVSPTPGATRDYVAADLNLGGVACRLIDVAGVNGESVGPLDIAAQETAGVQRREAELRLICIDAESGELVDASSPDEVWIATKVDLAKRNLPIAALACSSVTGEGLVELAQELRRRVGKLASEGGAATAVRCRESLREAGCALAAAGDLVGVAGEELLAAEIRAAVAAVGEVTGAVCADDVLDRVFRQFCIGK